MEFQKYNSIENSYRKQYINKLIAQGLLRSVQCVVQEKIHGANFSIWIKDGEIKFAKRTGFIKDLENFFNYEVLVDKLNDKLVRISKEEKNDIVIFGELFGGGMIDSYQSKYKNIGKGIFYSTDIEFYAFDLIVNGKYFPIDYANEFFDMYEIPRSKTLFRGNIEECILFDKNFQSLIPKELGFDVKSNNITEGVVIKPIEPLFLGDHRVILKNKTEKFSENVKEVKINPEIKFDNESKEIYNNLLTYVSENRLRNLLSKIGTVKDKEFGKLQGMFTKDIFDDFRKDNENIFDTVSATQKKVINKQLSYFIGNFIRERFLDIIDGTY